MVGDPANPPLFSCRVEADGRPLNTAFTNDGFNVRAKGAQVSRLVFDGLRFSGCSIALRMLTEQSGTYADIKIRNLSVSNAYAGLLINGVAEDLSIQDCSIVNADIGMLVAGTHVRSRRVKVSGNEVVGLAADQVAKFPQSGIFLDRADGRVHDNVVTGFSKFVIRVGIGIQTVNDFDTTSNVSIFGNFLSSNAIGILLGGRATASGRVFDNIVHLATRFGIFLRFGANGWQVGVNDFRDNAVDVTLAGPPLDPFGANGNTVYLLPGQTYTDGGTGNTIIVRD